MSSIAMWLHQKNENILGFLIYQWYTLTRVGALLGEAVDDLDNK